ncbi:MAG: hypothetical protein WC668_00385 [Patescibacteria group bacterium]|jgi:hypothetical protein
MKKTLKKLLASMLIVVAMSMFALPVLVSAQDDVQNIDLDLIASTAGIEQGNLNSIIGGILNVAMGFLGVIAVLIILYGGFIWMTAGGEQDKVDKAKKMIYAGIIGLVIIFAAYAIAMFVMSNLRAIVGSTGA